MRAAVESSVNVSGVGDGMRAPAVGLARVQVISVRARARCSAHVLSTLHVCVLCVGWRRRGAIHVALHHTQPLLVLVLGLELHTR